MVTGYEIVPTGITPATEVLEPGTRSPGTTS
jgi:hypothetical protein